MKGAGRGRWGGSKLGGGCGGSGVDRWWGGGGGLCGVV